MSVCGHDPYCPGHGPAHDAALSPAPFPAIRASYIKGDIERLSDAIREVRSLAPEARQLARSGHPAKKSEGRKALRQIDSEVARLNKEIRRLNAFL